MTDLPTISVTDEQAARLLAAFGTVDAYRTWLRARLVDYVLDQEQKRMAAEALAEQRAALDALRAELQ